MVIWRAGEMGKEFMKSPEIGNDGIDLICKCLSHLPDLYLPHTLATQVEPITQIERRDHLANLLRRDTAVFLGQCFEHPMKP